MAWKSGALLVAVRVAKGAVIFCQSTVGWPMGILPNARVSLGVVVMAVPVPLSETKEGEVPLPAVTERIPWRVPGCDGAKVRRTVQVLLAGRVAGQLVVSAKSPVRATVRAKGFALLLPMVTICVEVEVRVRVRVWAGLVDVTMPKSSSLGMKTMGVGVFAVEASVTVWVVALVAWAVRVPGFVDVRKRAMLHSPPGRRVVGQLCVRVKLVEVSWRLVAAALPRFRSVTFGLASVESARVGAAAVGLSLAR